MSIGSSLAPFGRSQTENPIMKAFFRGPLNPLSPATCLNRIEAALSRNELTASLREIWETCMRTFYMLRQLTALVFFLVMDSLPALVLGVMDSIAP